MLFLLLALLFESACSSTQKTAKIASEQSVTNNNLKKDAKNSEKATIPTPPKISPKIDSEGNELLLGANLYKASCGKCHVLHAANEYSPSEWVHHLKQMQPRAKINDNQRELIYKYLTTL